MYDRDQLAALTAVVETGSFEAAARRLQVTASAVSQRVKGLERLTGALVVRRTRPATATPVGETLVRLARQFDALEHDASDALGGATTETTVSVAVNADSVATWFTPALVAAAGELPLRFVVRVDDEKRTIDLLRDGSVMGAVTTVPRPVQGCRTVSLGALRYRAVVAASAGQEWDPAVGLRTADRVEFDTTDDIPRRVAGDLLPRGGPATAHPVRSTVHTVPSTEGYLAAIRAGLGWGAVPESVALQEIAAGRLVDAADGRTHDVPLHWQHWRIGSAALLALTEAVVTTARTHLVAPT